MMADWGSNLLRTAIAFVIGMAVGMLAEHHWRSLKDAAAAAKTADKQVLAIEASVGKQAAQLQHRLAVEQDRTTALLASQRARTRNAAALRMEITNAIFISAPDAHGCTDPIGSPQFEQLYDAARQAGRYAAPAGSAGAR